MLVGRALAPLRGKVTIATKFGFDIDPVTGARKQSGNRGGVNSTPEQIRRVCEGSLARLGVEGIDLLYQHRVVPAVPIEDVAGTLRDLIAEGKVAHFGMSEASPATIARAHAVQPVAAVQREYSLWHRVPEADSCRGLRALALALCPLAPWARGF